MSMNGEFYLLPVSYGQNRMWFFEKMFPDSATYNIPFIFKLRGSLNRAALTTALEDIMQRHEVFRTTFCEVEGQPVQRVSLLPAPFDLPFYKRDEIDTEGSLDLYLEDFAKTSFSLENGPLIHFELIEMEKNLHYLLINVHHIIFDAWSIDIFKKELYSNYTVHAAGSENSKEELEFHYADFAQWEKEVMEGLEDSGKLAFWKNYLEDAPSTMSLSPDYPRPKVSMYNGANHKFVIPDKLVEKARLFSQQNGMTLNTLFMSVFNVLLYRYTGQKDVVIGTPVSNRKEYFTQDLIGFFVNIIPIRTVVKPYSNIKGAVKSTLQSFLKSYENSEIPFERIVQEIRPERDATYHPIFQVLFTYHEKQDEIVQESGLTIEHEKINTATSKFDLAFYVTTDEKSGSGEIEYNPDLYHSLTMKRFAQHYLNLLNEVLDQPDKPISKLVFLTEDEAKESTENRWEKAVTDYLHDRFKRQLKRNNHGQAVKGAKTSYTFEDLNRRANQVANEIASRGIAPCSMIGIQMNRSPEQISAILGILKSGCAYLPMDPSLPVHRVQFILNDAGAKLLITDREELDMPCPTLSMEETTKCSEEELCLKWEALPPPQELTAYVIYTSGSTGKPKGVSISHASLLHHLDAYLDAFPMEEGERMLQNITFSFDASVTEIFGPLIGGATLILTEQEKQFDIEYLAHVISSESVTRAQLFHSLIEKLIEMPAFTQCRSLKRVFTGGEALNQKLVHSFYEAMEEGTEFINLYGPTEGTVAATYHLCEKNRRHSTVPIGMPFRGYHLCVCDENLELVPRGVEGELLIGGVITAKEYLNDEERTQKSFVYLERNGVRERFYRTGDIVRQSQDGIFQFISRKDTQIKIRGFRIELNEIKSVLTSMPEVLQAVVLAEEHQGERKLFTFIVKNEALLSAQEVKRHLMKELPHYMIPSNIVFVDALPLSPNGKLLKKELPFHLNHLMEEKKERARHKTDQAIVEIWETSLGVRPIGINEDFFDIGGHSIKAIEVIGAIRKQMGRELPLSLLFEYRTIENMSDWLLEPGEDHEGSLVVPLKKNQEDESPLFLVHPGGGGVLCYAKLAELLPHDGTIYGIQSVGYDQSETPLTEIPLMAQRYVSELRKRQADGPYRLAGWSMGGTLAVEMARILEEDGEEISFIGLLDAYPFHFSDVLEQRRDPLDVWAHTLNMDLEPFNELSEDGKLSVILDGAQEKGILPKNAELDDVKRIIAVMGANNVACDRYEFDYPIQSDLHIFRCSELDPVQPHLLVNEKVWGLRTKGTVHIVEIQGHHNNIMESPQVEDLADKMNQVVIRKEEFVLCR